MSGQTLEEKYYAINTGIARYLRTQNVRCPLLAFGINAATLKEESKDQTAAKSRFPYLQSYLLSATSQPWTSQASGVYTRFEYQLSFFTAPQVEFENQAALFLPFNLAKMALTDISLGALLSVDSTPGNPVTIADLLRIREDRSFSMISGAPVPKAVLVAEFAAVCAYPVATFDPGISTDLDAAVVITPEE